MHTKQTYEKSLDENPIVPNNIETHLHHSSKTTAQLLLMDLKK